MVCWLALRWAIEALCRKGFTEHREVGIGFHGRTPFHRASNRSRAAVISSGVLLRYQYVPVTLA